MPLLPDRFLPTLDERRQRDKLIMLRRGFEYHLIISYRQDEYAQRQAILNQLTA
jgi:hypothetical protein